MTYKYTFEVRAAHPIIDKALEPINEMIKPMIDQTLSADFYLCESHITSGKKLTSKQLNDISKIIKDGMQEVIDKKEPNEFVITTVKHIKTGEVL